jgi:hypothetical protein
VLVGVTRFAVGGGMFNPVPVQGMLDFQMTFEAVDFVVSDVGLVYEFVFVDPLQIVLSIMTHSTAFARHFAIAADEIAVTVRAVDSAFVSQLVAKLYATSKIKLVFRNLVATGAGSQPLVEQPVFEMTQKARGRRHRHVLPLDNLAVTTGTAQFFPASQFRQMRPMVERDSMKIDTASE